MIIPNIWENKIDVPNHQPEVVWIAESPNSVKIVVLNSEAAAARQVLRMGAVHTTLGAAIAAFLRHIRGIMSREY